MAKLLVTDTAALTLDGFVYLVGARVPGSQPLDFEITLRTRGH